MPRVLKPKIAFGAAVLAAFLLALFPALPARAGTVEDANQFLKKTFTLDFDYFKSKNQAGKPLREIALAGEASEDWPMLAWGEAHGDKKTDSRGRTQHRYVGYSYFGEDVTNPFFPPDETAGGRLDQRNWIEKPWEDSRTKHLVYDWTFDTKSNPWLTERLRWGLYWAAKCNGFDPPSTASDLYKNPQKYVHVILPPAEGTWGMGRMWHVTSGGKVWYVSVPLGPPHEMPKVPNFYVKSFDPGCPKDASGSYVAEVGKTYTATVVFGAKDEWPDIDAQALFPTVGSVIGAHRVGQNWYAASLKLPSSLAGRLQFASAGGSDVSSAGGRAWLLPKTLYDQQGVMFESDGAEITLAFNWTAQPSSTALAAAINVIFPPEGDPLLKPVAWEAGAPPGGAPDPEEIIKFINSYYGLLEDPLGTAADDNVAEVEIKVKACDFYVKSLDPGTSEVIEGVKYTGTVTFGLKPGAATQKAKLALTHNGWSVSGVDGQTVAFSPGEEKSFSFRFTGQAADSVLRAEIWPAEGEDTNSSNNVKTVTVPLRETAPDQTGGGLTFKATSQTGKYTRPAGTAKWTDWVTATFEPPKVVGTVSESDRVDYRHVVAPKLTTSSECPGREDYAVLKSWRIVSAKLTYPKQHPDFVMGAPYEPLCGTSVLSGGKVVTDKSKTVTVSMDVIEGGHKARAKFQEMWSMDGAPVYNLLEGRMMAENPQYYTLAVWDVAVEVTYRVTHFELEVDEETGEEYCVSERWTETKRYTMDGPFTGRLLVNGTGVDSRAQ